MTGATEAAGGASQAAGDPALGSAGARPAARAGRARAARAKAEPRNRRMGNLHGAGRALRRDFTTRHRRIEGNRPPGISYNVTPMGKPLVAILAALLVLSPALAEDPPPAIL